MEWEVEWGAVVERQVAEELEVTKGEQVAVQCGSQVEEWVVVVVEEVQVDAVLCCL